MLITYRDDLGYVTREIENDIAFIEGFAYFTSDNIDYKIRAEQLVEIAGK